MIGISKWRRLGASLEIYKFLGSRKTFAAPRCTAAIHVQTIDKPLEKRILLTVPRNCHNDSCVEKLDYLRQRNLENTSSTIIGSGKTFQFTEKQVLGAVSRNSPFSEISVEEAPTKAPATRLVLKTETFKKNLAICMQLSKARLAIFVTLTAIAGCGMAPAPFSFTTLTAVTVGTALCAASANSFNQLMESPFDAQMQRTRARPLVRHMWRPATAAAFVISTGVTGVAVLAFGSTFAAAFLGGANILLYALVYTPSKRLTEGNTWIGSVVGSIPPVLGWSACMGWPVLPYDFGAYVLGYLLFAWQFPHFAALSWGLRSEYARAGYRMMATTRPDLNARVALTYSVQLLTIFPMTAVASGMVTPMFFATSSMVNIFLVFRSYQFWRTKEIKNARRLFFATLFYLPAILGAMMIHRENGRIDARRKKQAQKL